MVAIRGSFSFMSTESFLKLPSARCLATMAAIISLRQSWRGGARITPMRSKTRALAAQ